MHKLITYVTHDEIIGALFKGMGAHRTKGAIPASSLFLEFFKDTSQNNAIFVRAYYKKSISKSKGVNVGGQTTSKMPIADFENIIRSRINATNITDLKTQCA